MSEDHFAIPTEYRDQVEYRQAQDERSHVEILESLTHHRPVTSEKNVWAFWHSGVLSMPGWCQRNVVNWVRLLDSSWTVRVLDANPDSENYMLKYVDASTLNDAMVDGTMDGPYFGAHSADLLRGPCLFVHGGVFMDVGILLIRDLDRICWNQLADSQSSFQVSVPWMYGITMANHFVASRKGDPFIERWYGAIPLKALLVSSTDNGRRHKLFVHLWKNRSNYEGLIEDPLVSFAQELSFDDSRASNFHWNFKVSSQVVFEYITQVVCWMRICMLEDPNDDFDGPEYWQNKVLIWDVLQENWGAEATVGFSGEKMFDLLCMRLDSDPESPEYKEAHKLVWRLLTKSSMQKVVHGKNLTSDRNLGLLWDENPGKDCEPVTFAELLRYGSVHFEQTRKEIEYVQAPAPEKTLKKGLLES